MRELFVEMSSGVDICMSVEGHSRIKHAFLLPEAVRFLENRICFETIFLLPETFGFGSSLFWSMDHGMS